MFFASDKNFPKFIHFDTIVKSLPEPFFIQKTYKKPVKNLKKTVLPYNKSLEISHEKKNWSKNDISLNFSCRKTSKNGKNGKISSPTNQKKQDFPLNFTEKTENFMKYMKYQNEKNPEEGLFRNLVKKRRAHQSILSSQLRSPLANEKMRNLQNQIDLSSSALSIKSKPRISHQKTSFLFPSINEFNNWGGNQINLKKIATSMMTLSENNRLKRLNIANYNEFFTVLKELEKNLTDYIRIFGYNERSTKILKSLLSKKIDMKHLFFNEENGKMFENFNIYYIEEKCIIRETLYDNNKFIKKAKIEPLMIEELRALNEKIEEVKNHKYIEDLRNTKDSLLMGYKKLKNLESTVENREKRKDFEYVEKLNFEMMPNIGFMKEIDEFERQFGEFSLIDKKSKMVGRVLEELIADIKKNAKSVNERPKFPKKKSQKII